MLLLSCAFVFYLFCFLFVFIIIEFYACLKGNEKLQSHLEIETRRNYFPDHLLMQIILKHKFVRLVDTELVKLRILSILEKLQIRICVDTEAVTGAVIVDHSSRFEANLLWPRLLITHFGPRN